jgi:hypothetical protein
LVSVAALLMVFWVVVGVVAVAFFVAYQSWAIC